MKSLTTITVLATVLALALTASGPALAQLSTNTSAPIDITGDGLETGNNDCSWTWRGNVEALQDNARLRTDLLTGIQQRNNKPGAQAAQGGSCGDLLRLEAHGSVYYMTPQQKVHGDDAVYEALNATLTVTGNVVAVQGQNVLRGERLVVNTKTGQGQMQTSVKGRNMPGRVRGVFYPNNKPDSANAAGGKPATPAAAGAKPPAPAGQRR